MADDIKIYSRNWLLDPYATVTPSAELAGFEAEKAIDRDEFSSWRTITGTSRTLTFYLGPTARTFDSLLYYWNLADGTLEHSNDGAAWSPTATFTGLTTSAGILSFTAQTAKYMRLTTTLAQGVTPPQYIIYELGLCDAVYDLSWVYVRGLTVPGYEDVSQKVAATWDGVPLTANQGRYLGAVTADLTQVPDSVLTALREVRHGYQKVTVWPQSTYVPKRWFNCYWSAFPQFSFVQNRNSEQILEGSITWTECG